MINGPFDLIGIPYEQMNCWDIAREFYRVCLGKDLKHYFDGDVVPERLEIKQLIYVGAEDFEEVKEPLEFGDLLIFKIRGIESHIGVYVSPGKFLHSQKTIGSCIERLEKWKHLLVGAYRLRSKTL